MGASPVGHRPSEELSLLRAIQIEISTDTSKIDALFAELKQQTRLRRARLRRLSIVAEQFHLAATAKNFKFEKVGYITSRKSAYQIEVCR